MTVYTIQRRDRFGSAMSLTAENAADVLSWLLHSGVNAHATGDETHPIRVIDGEHGTTSAPVGSIITVFDGRADWVLSHAFESRYEVLDPVLHARDVIIDYLTQYRAEIIGGIVPTLRQERAADVMRRLSDEDIVGIVLNGMVQRLKAGAPTEIIVDAEIMDPDADLRDAIQAETESVIPDAVVTAWVLAVEYREGDAMPKYRTLVPGGLPMATALGLTRIAAGFIDGGDAEAVR